MDHDLHLTGDAAADELLSTVPLALLIAMLLDQQVTFEVAFAGPHKIAQRLGGLDVEAIARHEREAFAALCAARPAVHRFPRAMAGRIQALCAFLLERYGGDVEALWMVGDPDGAELLRRLLELPGFGEQKSRLTLAVLGKRLGVDAPGWREEAGSYGREGTYFSVADIADDESRARVLESKRMNRAARAGSGHGPRPSPHG